ncbi:MAG: F0F1 ATP synthase subunit delta [Firmicutes bacterium]|uniref:ATP synthase subunit delta n=1 Tax=Melghirimyces thermohalophilus TaxID=1236220 RepID=A0A1G6MBY9_9BACL|nr:F0F1 ATP synthase subunit delta [Melghirimyces thermohalophilus]MDA8353764.1 F0F1 ATP synthase subunit delta [Bacillota bacterium]SDC52951.1 F-type H+-transporting ATPase subunit delta [Melghirimyces thermohalophilus]
MSRSIVAKRYARALFDASQERDVLDQVQREWHGIVRAWSGSEQLQNWVEHPRVTTDDKKQVFNQIFPNLSDLTRNLLHLLLERNREEVIEEIGEEYKRLVYDAKGIAEAEVITAVPLSEEEEKELIAVFQKKIGKTLVISNRVDSDILGGLIVRIGDRLYDGSLTNKLKRFRKQLNASRVG